MYDFRKIIEECNALKEYYCFCSLAANAPRLVNGGFGFMVSASDTLGHMSYYLSQTCTAANLTGVERIILSAKETCVPQNIRAEFKKFKKKREDAGTKWFADEAYYFGPFWNEVELPEPIKAAFTDYIEMLSKEVPGMIGPEDALDTIPDNAMALSIYMLSDFRIVFDEKGNETFFKKYGIEDTDILHWNGDRWTQ